MFLLWRHNRRCDNRTCLECKTSVRSCFYLSLTDHKENSHTLSDLFPPHIRYTMAGWREKQSPTLCFRYSHGGFLSEMCPLDLPSIFCLSYQKYYKDVCVPPWTSPCIFLTCGKDSLLTLLSVSSSHTNTELTGFPKMFYKLQSFSKTTNETS